MRRLPVRKCRGLAVLQGVTSHQTVTTSSVIQKWCNGMKNPPVLEVIRYSGLGKTTLIEKLIPELRQDGVRLAVIKHTSHQHELDLPGKDSYRLRTG